MDFDFSTGLLGFKCKLELEREGEGRDRGERGGGEEGGRDCHTRCSVLSSPDGRVFGFRNRQMRKNRSQMKLHRIFFGWNVERRNVGRNGTF